MLRLPATCRRERQDLPQVRHLPPSERGSVSVYRAVRFGDDLDRDRYWHRGLCSLVRCRASCLHGVSNCT